MSTTAQLLTAGDLASQKGRCELVRGGLIETTPAGAEHGRIAMDVGAAISFHVKANRLGQVFAAETGFLLERDPDTVRAPDIAFVRTSRLPKRSVTGFFQGPPDLAVEVLSPSDTASEINDKIQQWLEAGCEQAWVVDPRTRTVTVYERTGQIRMLKAADRLSGGELLPGFELKVEDIFAQ